MLHMLQPIPMVRVSSPVFSETEEAAPPPTRLLEKLRAGKFVVSVEVDPPRGFSAAKMLEGARIAQEHGADAVNVADSPMARVRMGALALCVLIQQQVGIETILHYTTRDRSLMAIQADLIGAHALGCVTSSRSPATRPAWATSRTVRRSTTWTRSAW